MGTTVRRSSLKDLSDPIPKPVKFAQIVDMDTVQEEISNDSDSSCERCDRTRSGRRLEAPQILTSSLSQPPSRRMSTDAGLDQKLVPSYSRRPSAIIAAFRRPSQALALCADTQRRFLSELAQRHRDASNPSIEELREHHHRKRELDSIIGSDSSCERCDRTRSGRRLEAPQILTSSLSQPPSRRMSTDAGLDQKLVPSYSRRPSAIIAAFRRPSQALALCADTQRRFLSELAQRHRDASNPSIEELREHHHRKRELDSIIGRDALTTALSALYAKLLIVLGIAFPVTEVISVKVPDNYYQGFYLWLYTTSVAYVIFMYASVIREKTYSAITKSCSAEEAMKQSEDFPRPKPKGKTEIVTRFGSFYLRLGAIAFGIGSMVYSGLEFGQYFEINDNARCRRALVALTPAVRMILTLLQMQFIFLNSKEMGMDRYKMLHRFGLMHMVATNLCEWLYVIVAETKHEIIHLEHNLPFNDSHSTNSSASIEIQGCRNTNIMGPLMQNASPFLFPCTIEYSLICAVVLFEMWKDIKSDPDEIERKLTTSHSGAKLKEQSRSNSFTPEKILQQFATMMGVNGDKATHHFSLDCSHAHYGLFAGILVIVLTIISLIMFFVLSKDRTLVSSGIFEVNVCELFLYVLSLVAIVVAARQMRVLKYKRTGGAVLGLDTTLLVMAQAGMFVYCMFSIIGCYFTMSDEDGPGVTGLLSELLSLIQTVVQTMFILDAWWRRCKTSEHHKNKPGRQIVTFLLVANMAMWTINTLEKNRAEFRPTHLKFFGFWAWTIITHVSMPLAIFYRFHSTICLFEIWKSSFKSKPIYISVQNNY